MTPGYQSAYTYRMDVAVREIKERIETPEEQAEREIQEQVAAIMAVHELFILSIPLEVRTLFGVRGR